MYTNGKELTTFCDVKNVPVSCVQKSGGGGDGDVWMLFLDRQDTFEICSTDCEALAIALSLSNSKESFPNLYSSWKEKSNDSSFPWGMHFTMAECDWACITREVRARCSELSRWWAFFERNAEAVWSGGDLGNLERSSHDFIWEASFLSRPLFQECKVMGTDLARCWLQEQATSAAKMGQHKDSSWKRFQLWEAGGCPRAVPEMTVLYGVPSEPA